nr:olfactory receptor 52R1-like [Pelodiscus sinensis]|eukprot:XP_025040742.1 olfactory receptor 52R1-like [Pelodiscus sinensis]
MYIITILGNFTILFIVKMEPSLHEPMYYFLCILSITDLLYFVHSFSVIESGILVAMAFDRYVAICHPLRHSAILNKPVVAKICLAVVLQGAILALPYPFLARQWPYCRTNIIPYTHCEHMPVVKLACVDIRAFVLRPLSLILVTYRSSGDQKVQTINSLLRHNPSTFILQGIPGLEAAHVWISIPFCAMYILSILGNVTILFIVKREPSLHEPMYYFLCMLAITDLVLCTSTIPKLLSIFWFNSREIGFSACLTQLYFVHTFSVIESGIYVAMAFDRYVAICDPLRHSTILNNSVVAKIGLAVVLRGAIFALPYPFLARHWPYCRTNVIPYTHCEHMDVVKLACADIRASSYYGLFVLICRIGLDVLFISVSYIQILKAIFRLTKDARLKTFGTCSSHLCAILTFYIPGLFSSLTYRFGQNVPLHFHILIGNMQLLEPPMLNPIIYGVMTKQIRARLLRLFSHKET